MCCNSGGGIAGLALASFLCRTNNISVEVYEAKLECRTEGAGLAMWKRYWTILNTLIDFDKACAAKKAAVPGWDGGKCAALCHDKLRTDVQSSCGAHSS